MMTISPKTLTRELKPVCAQVRKQTTPTKRYQMPLMGAVRITATNRGLSAAYLWDEETNPGPFPNPAAELDILLDLDNAYALATILDPQRPASLTVEKWEEEYTVNAGYPKRISCRGQTLTVTQPSASRRHTDVMRFKTLEP